MDDIKILESDVSCEHPQDKQITRTKMKVWCTNCGSDLKFHVTSEMKEREEEPRKVNQHQIRAIFPTDEELLEVLTDIYNGDYSLKAYRQDCAEWLVDKQENISAN